MRMTIGTKLALGFGAVITLLVVSAYVAYRGQTRMMSNNDRVLDSAVPLLHTCTELLGAVNYSVGTVRGYMIAGADASDVDLRKESLKEAWATIDQCMARLGQFTKADIAGVNDTSLNRVRTTISELRTMQNEVIAAVGEYGSQTSQQFMSDKVMPVAGQLFDELSAMIEQTRRAESADAKQLSADLDGLRSQLAMSVAELREYITTGNDERKASFANRWQAVLNQEAVSAEHGASRSAEQAAAWTEVKSAITELDLRAKDLLDLRADEGVRQGRQMLESELAPRVRALRDDLEGMQQAADAALKSNRSEIQAGAKSVQRTLIIAASMAVVIAALIAVGLSRSMARGLQAVVSQAQAIARGDLRGEALNVRSRDEVYDLARAFESMRSGLRDLAAQMREATENVNTSAAEIVASTQQQAAAMKEQAAAIQEISSTIQEIDESGTQIEQRARRVSTDAEAASDASAKGGNAAQDANRTMQGIREQVEQVAENIVNLSERTQTIGEIVATVTDLAEQSNLLALNASIEAVSAGEQGNRFSVVANEMKNLAEQAKACTVQVRTILGEIQKGIHASVMLTEESVKRVEQGKQQAEVTENVIRQMSDTTQRCVQAFEQIVGGSNQQQIGVSQVAQGMKGIQQAVEQTAAGTAQLERAASSLGALSRQLHGVASRYQL